MTTALTNPATALPDARAEVRALALDPEDRVRPSWLHPRRVLLLQLGRHLAALLDRIQDPAGTLLDVGCGRCPYRELVLERFGTYVGADLAWNPGRDLIIAADGTLPLPDGAVDAAMSSQVLQAVPEPQDHLREIHRVLRDGGSVLISANAIWPYVPEPVDLRRWTLEGLRHELQSAGFTIVEERSIFGLASTAVQLLQDATTSRLPRGAKPLAIGAAQVVIRGLETMRRERDGANTNGCINVLLCRKVIAR